MVCPVHEVNLTRSETQYGPRWDCQEHGCDVMCWGSSTSTPADQATRDARHLTHLRFDPLWQKGLLKRKQAYALLSEWMKLPPKETHIGMFSVEQCREAYRFCLSIEAREKEDA
jgi:hypothetical protein